MKKAPLISVIIPSFNSQAYIGRCLRSLIKQSLHEDMFEILVINDGSLDQSNIILKSYGDSIKVINNKTNIGLPASLNKAIKKSKGKYIVRVDSDDYVNDNFLLFLQSYLDFNPHTHAVACDYYLVNDYEELIKRCNTADDPIACGIMFRKNSFLDIGLYDEEFRGHEDLEFRIRFLAKYEIAQLKIPLYRYRRHENNMTNDKEHMDSFLENIKKKHKAWEE